MPSHATAAFQTKIHDTPAPTADIHPFPVPRSPALDRPKGSRLPHAAETIAIVRLLYERTTLTYERIAQHTGIAPSSVTRYAQIGGWKRPAGAAHSPWANRNGYPSARVQERLLAARLRDIATRWLNEMENDTVYQARDLTTVRTMLADARGLENRRRPRAPLEVRARRCAERFLDLIEAEPGEPPYELHWVLKMLEMAREEEAKRRGRMPDDRDAFDPLFHKPILQLPKPTRRQRRGTG